MSETQELIEGAGSVWTKEAEFIEALRLQMLKFAKLQLNDEYLAEDAVQEALIGAFKNADSFTGRSALKTWVFAILKNKIVDIFRQRQRLVEVSSLFGAESDEDDKKLDSLFDKGGFWHVDKRPKDWADPDEALLDEQFWRIFETCLDRLPPRHAKFFMMREMIELETKEICDQEGISVSNLHVLLHRARLRLRECLDVHWFNQKALSC